MYACEPVILSLLGANFRWCWGAASHDTGTDAEALQAARKATDTRPAATHSTGCATGRLLKLTSAHMHDMVTVWLAEDSGEAC